MFLFAFQSEIQINQNLIFYTQNFKLNSLIKKLYQKFILIFAVFNKN
jgi:hypothetical protein